MIPSFQKKNILITGGLGFIGSNLAIALTRQGASVTILDNLWPGLGGNKANISEISDRVIINYGDVRDPLVVAQLVKGQEYIFHLARQTDHIISQTDPYPDIDINIRGTAVLLEAIKKHNPTVRFIYTGTRGQYGKAVTLPVAETAPTNPRGVYELTNLAAEKLVQIYHDVHHISSIMLRLTNIYGPRGQMHHNRYGIVNWFIRQAMDGEQISVFGDGMLKRDFIYIDDAIDAILRCTLTDGAYGEIINIGSPQAETFVELVTAIVKAAGSGGYTFTPFSPERAAQEPGDFTSDITKLTQLTGWKPTTSLKKGIQKTIAYYKNNKHAYWS